MVLLDYGKINAKSLGVTSELLGKGCICLQTATGEVAVLSSYFYTNYFATVTVVDRWENHLYDRMISNIFEIEFIRVDEVT